MLRWQIGGITCNISMLFPAVFLCLLYFDETGLSAFGFSAAVLHECGHIVMLYLLKIRPRSLTISFYGMRLELDALSSEPVFKTILIAAAGPIANVMCACAFYLFTNDVRFALMHLLLAAMNLLPLDPLDGGQIAKTCLSLIFQEQAIRRCMSLLFLCVWLSLTGLGVWIFLHSRYNFTLLMVSFYLLLLKLFYKEN